ncbi:MULTISPECIES: hypothetical protein [unclassified Pseudoalteromonas]|uniref:hypothetical protein n=1 Tax=unclassified Pseudoalteromonas TaxID=194690 RepID=UPI0030154DEA
MKPFALAALLLVVTSCTPADISQAQSQLELAIQQRDLNQQVSSLSKLAQYDQQFQQPAQQAKRAQLLLHQAEQQYDQGKFLDAQLSAAQSKALNNSFQIDQLLRELGSRYPLTELINALVQLNDEASRARLSLTSFFHDPLETWSIIDLNKKLSAINQAIAEVKKQMSAVATENRALPAYQETLQIAHDVVVRLQTQQHLLLQHVQQQISHAHLEKFTQLHQSAHDKVRNFTERVVYTMMDKKHKALIRALQHESELLFNVKMTLERVYPKALPMFAPFYDAYVQLLNRPQDYNEYVTSGHHALATLNKALSKDKLSKQYQALTRQPLPLTAKLLAFAESQNKYRFLYRPY